MANDKREISLTELIDMVNNPQKEGLLYEHMEELRERSAKLLGKNISGRKLIRENEISLGATVVAGVLKRVLERKNPTDGDPGHGPGHWCRDYLHTLYLSRNCEDEAAIVPAIVAGSLHDIGTLFVDRYADRNRAVRHAEIGALIVDKAFEDLDVGITQEEMDVCAYAIAAHTHYLKPQEVECRDGVKRMVKPFTDMVDDKPVMGVWLPRWADRLDISGPCMVGRHYLTLNRDHFDYSKDGFYKVEFGEHMRPVLRSDDEIKAGGGRRTMVEHFKMFASSQTNASVYGRHDRGAMLTLRDRYRTMMENIIDAVVNPTEVDVERVLKAWNLFLVSNIEPDSRTSAEAVNQLNKGFRKLDDESRQAWACGFRQTMVEYLVWSDMMLEFSSKLPSQMLRMPGVFRDVRDVVRPDRIWVSTLLG